MLTFPPSRLTFMTTDNQEYVAIFKHGDDLRQDQLILQMITLMDKLLRRENLDLKLTPYRVLATSTKHGFLQFINSVTVAEVLATEGNIHNFFRKHNPCETGPFGIVPEVMDTYIRSCAGYCVITYLLGVGDRHLDNLLLTTSGKVRRQGIYGQLNIYNQNSLSSYSTSTLATFWVVIRSQCRRR